MNTSTLWTALRSKLGATAAPRRSVALQHLGLADNDVGDLQHVLNKVGDELALTLELQGHAGDIVLLDVPFASRLSPQLVNAFTEGRPVVLISGLNGESERGLSTLERFERRQRALLRQLKEIPLVRRRSANAASWGADNAATVPQDTLGSGFDASFDSRLDAEPLSAEELERGQREVLMQVLRGLTERHTVPLAASYGPDANVLFDFRAHLVFIDPLAQQHLRVRRELPQPAPGARPQTDATVRELDETLWDMGLAAGPFPLLDAPADWWHAPLVLTQAGAIDRYSRIPRHLDMARRLADGPVTPSELRRHAGVSVADLRRFIQACLVLRLVQWAPAASDSKAH